MKIEFIMEEKSTSDLDIREVLINIKFSDERSFSEILTEIRALKGVTVISIVRPSRMISGSIFDDNKARTYFATIKVKIEIKKLGIKNYIKYLHNGIKAISGIISLQVKRKAVPQIDKHKAQEIKNLLTI